MSSTPLNSRRPSNRNNGDGASAATSALVAVDDIPIDLDRDGRDGGEGDGGDDDGASSAASSEETFEEPRFCCTPMMRIAAVVGVLIVAAVGIGLGLSQPWNSSNDLASSSDDGRTFESDVGGGIDTDDYAVDYSIGPTSTPSLSDDDDIVTRAPIGFPSPSVSPAPNVNNGENFPSPSLLGTPAPNSVSSPTPAPNRPPVGAEDFERYRFLLEAIIEFGALQPSSSSFIATGSDASASPPSTPQQAALNWLAFDDPLRIDARSIPPERIAQRYAISVLYFGTAGANWKIRDDWLGMSHECDWHGISCSVRPILAHAGPQVQVTMEETMVTQLDLHDNNLFGVLPQEIAALRWLDTLGLYGNILGGPLPTQIGSLTSLKRLWLDDNFFTGQIPTQVGDMIMLEQLDVFKNNFGSQIPESIGRLTNLKRFSGYDNKFEGTLPSTFGDLINLEELFLDTNEIGGSIPPQLSGATKLRDLRLFQNKLVGNIPTSLGSLSNLKVFYVDTNELTGQIPPAAVSGWTSLVDFQAYSNNLGGFLPEQFGSLPELTVIHVADNNIGGILPEGLCQQGSKILKLDMSRNALVGSIPVSVGNLCTQMIRLHLPENTLSFSIPTQIGQMKNLKSLYLNNNRLQGSIPSDLMGLSSLQELHLENNLLTGTVPFELCGQLKSAQSDCEGVNAQVECSCCTLCCGLGGCLAPQLAYQLPKSLVLP